MKLTLHEIIIFLFFGLVIIGAIALVAAWFVAMFKYGTTPVQELPTWAYFILRGGQH